MKNKSVVNIFVAMCLLSTPAFADLLRRVQSI